MPTLGSKKHPLVLHVQTADRAYEILEFCDTQGWQAIVGIEPDKSENLSDLNRKKQQPISFHEAPKTQRNASCPCGSGKKYKKCCLNSA